MFPMTFSSYLTKVSILLKRHAVIVCPRARHQSLRLHTLAGGERTPLGQSRVLVEHTTCLLLFLPNHGHLGCLL